MTQPNIRVMRPADIAAGLHLCRLENWNQTEADWLRLLSLGAEGCFVAEVDGTPAGTVTTIRHGKSLGWVGMLLVHPAHRRHGIGTALLERAVGHLKLVGTETIKLDATDLGQEVYRQLGFIEEYPLARCTAKLDQFHESELVRATNPMTAELVEAVVGFDEAAFGADRGELIRGLWEDNPAGNFVFRAVSGEVQGYIMVRPGANAWYLGPWIAANDDIALNLLYQALVFVGTDQSLMVDICSRCTGLSNVLEYFGFRSVRAATRMYIGPNLRPGRPERMYGLSGLETG